MSQSSGPSEEEGYLPSTKVDAFVDAEHTENVSDTEEC